MAGYLRADAPGVLEPPADGWHDTGDIVTIDDDGFVTIRGRAKRFAKIGGEMVSLPRGRGLCGGALARMRSTRSSPRPDPRKGEQLVLVTTRADAKTAALQAWARRTAWPKSQCRARSGCVEALPVLGTGKLDYVTMTALAAG